MVYELYANTIHPINIETNTVIICVIISSTVKYILAINSNIPLSYKYDSELLQPGFAFQFTECAFL